jgi:ferredoxin-NADP reductase
MKKDVLTPSAMLPVKKQYLEVLVKLLEGGKVSGYFNEHLHMDEMLEVMPPMGGLIRLIIRPM